MSALARYFNSKGIKVYGYDKVPTSLTKELVSEGITIHYEDDVKWIPENIKSLKEKAQKADVLVVYTPALPANHNELNFFIKHKFVVRKRSQVLGAITKNLYTIAVAGTHGKTTTSSMIAHILLNSGYNCSAFLGGVILNYNTNYLQSKTKLSIPEKQHPADFSQFCIVEADEYDRSFLELYPDIGVITSMDADHLDIYGSKQEMEIAYQQFANQIKQNGLLIIKKGLPISIRNKNRNVITYSAVGEGDYYASNIRKNSEHQCRYEFDIVSPSEKIRDVNIVSTGSYNIENTVAAVAVTHNLKVDKEKIKSAMSNFSGVKRRFEFIYKSKDVVYIDDYAHHPKEISACLQSLRDLYPDKKITAIFQPHLFSRTRDFLNEFAQSLSVVDKLILLPIYPAREEPIAGVSADLLFEKVNLKNKILCEKEQLLEHLEKSDIEVLLTIGAGDIDQFVEPIKKLCRQISAKKLYPELKKVFDGEILLNEPMSSYTTLKIGGPADIFLKPASKKGIIKAVEFLENNNIPYMAFGRGSNLLVGDDGIPGVVIAMNFGLDYLDFKDNLIIAGAAYSWAKLVLESIKMGYKGLEGTAGIPASVGGVTIMNAGAYGTEVFDYITEVQVLRKGKLQILKSNEIEFKYRYTNLKNDIVLETTFKLNKTDNIDETLSKRKKLLDQRNSTQPLNKPNVGSLFKNPQGNFAAKLIQDCGLKGYKHGNVQVSDKHANFLINIGGGTAKEMMELIELVQKTVYEKFKIMLEMEVLKVGEGF